MKAKPAKCRTCIDATMTRADEWPCNQCRWGMTDFYKPVVKSNTCTAQPPPAKPVDSPPAVR